MIKATQVNEIVSPLYDLGISEKEISEKWTRHFLENN